MELYFYDQSSHWAINVITWGLGIKESADPDKAALDPLGQLLSVVALAGLTYGLIEAGDMGWTSLPTIAGLMIGGIAALGFVIVELNVPRPLLPIFLFKQNPYFLQYNLASFALGFATYSNVFFIALFLQKGQGWGAFEAGLRMAPEFIAMALFSFSFGRLSRTLSVRNIMVIGFLLIATASMLLTRVNSDTEYLPIAAILFILGAGMGMATPAIGALVMASVEKAYSGIASAVMNALRQTGMTLGIALLGTLMTHRAIDQLMEDPQISRLLSEGEVDGLIKGSVAASSHFIEQATQSAFVSGFNLAMLGGAISIMLCLALMMKTSQIVRGK
ncbi:MFS transporter [Providencia rustigianii]|uniref:MFS transporter n=1 Tax=Providencia rustigianii TaxID=158850 RepID=UPI001E552358|nr:MFS transporter [Providencia rustigianii]